MEIEVKVPFSKKLAFNALTDTLQREVHRKMLRAAASAIKKEYRKRAPSGHKTGTSWRQSEDTRLERDGINARTKNQLKKSLVDKPSSKWSTKRKLARAGIIATKVGHRYTKGDPKSARYAHLVNFGHVAVYWGNRSGGRVKGIHYQEEAQMASKRPVAAAVKVKAKQAIKVAAKKARAKMKARR